MWRIGRATTLCVSSLLRVYELSRLISIVMCICIGIVLRRRAIPIGRGCGVGTCRDGDERLVCLCWPTPGEMVYQMGPSCMTRGQDEFFSLILHLRCYMDQREISLLVKAPCSSSLHFCSPVKVGDRDKRSKVCLCHSSLSRPHSPHPSLNPPSMPRRSYEAYRASKLSSGARRPSVIE